MKRKICVITSTRADFGLLHDLSQRIQASNDLELQLVVSGTHLKDEFGKTILEIENSGLSIADKVDFLSSEDGDLAVVKSLALATKLFAESYHRLQPNLVLVLGDRFEIMAAASAAFLMSFPVAHIHGGEVTAGAKDDSIRHSITKMSHIHFTAAETYRKRVIQLGERPQYVFNVGAPGLDRFKRMIFLKKEDLEKSLDVKFQKTIFLVTYHPETMSDRDSYSVNNMIASLKKFLDVTVVFTMPNADSGGRGLSARFEKECQKNRNWCFVKSLGSLRYASLMSHCDLVVGNSSSGLIEAPFFCVPTVNIGKRQEGRLRAKSIIDSGIEEEEILASIERGLSKEFKKSIEGAISLYGEGESTKSILRIISEVDLEDCFQKNFFDLPVELV